VGDLGLTTSGARPGDRVLFAPRAVPALRPDVSGDLPRYRQWLEDRQRRRVAESDDIAAGPEIAVLLIVEDPDARWLERCLRSVASQTAAHWHLLVSVIGSPSPEAEAALSRGLDALPGRRTRLRMFPAGTDRAEALAGALDASASPACMVLDQHDQLAPDAVSLLSAALVDADLAYGDEDRSDDEGAAYAPVLKPDWSPELVLSWCYVGRPLAARVALVVAAGGFRATPGGDWEHDLVLRVTERTQRVAHVAEVLCHRRPPSAPRGGAPGPAAVEDALRRRGEPADVRAGPLPGTWRLVRRPARRPRVTAIVPFRNSPTLLRACVDSVMATTGDVDLELVLVDNGSDEPESLTLTERLAQRPHVTVRRDPRPFNWAALNNAAVEAAVEAAGGDVLLFLNDDVEALRPGWLSALAAHVLRPDVGVAGARLLYPDGRVQHAGMVIGLGGAAGHVLGGLPGDRPGYLGMAVLTRDVSAVTGACMATRRETFDRLGRFDEDLGLDLNDVDYCLRARARGMRVVYEPAAELVHHESPSRGTSGSTADIARFVDRWEELITAGDPYLSPHLTRQDVTAALQEPDEAARWSRWRSTLADP
jgi:O-antigen biosynthesis protein